MPAANLMWQPSVRHTVCSSAFPQKQCLCHLRQTRPSSHIIEEAKKNIDVQEQNFEELIADLETSRATIEKEQERIISL